MRIHVKATQSDLMLPYRGLNESVLLNDLDPDVLIKPIPFSDDHWKNKVVIGCTIAVAIEVLIVLLMVMYWDQIRWTLRKLTCPCVRLLSASTLLKCF